MKLSGLSDKPIYYIYHISDIHIHCDKRHNEYKNIFSEFFNILDKSDNLDNSLVVITGNLLNTKNRITSPEIILAREFIYNLSQKCSIIIIPGNNDKDENIKAIISKGDIPLGNINYLNKSGCYTLNNINFIYITDGKTSETSDTLENSPEIKQAFNQSSIEYKNIYNIGLYHGIVDHCLLYNGKHVSSKEMLASTFKDFDCTLLGGVSKTQFVDRNNKIGYSGTMIQKDFEEDWNDHGYLLWNLKNIITDKPTHYPVNNKYRFVKLKILDGKLMTVLQNLPENLYIKWDITESGIGMEDKINQIQNDIRKKYNVLEEVYIHNSFVPEIQNISENNFSFDLSVEKQEEYAIEWLKTEGNILKENEKEDIAQLIKYYNQKITKKEVPYIKWKLIDLEFENILCYSKKQKITFENLKGLQGIIAQNNAGKSALFDILVFSLFGKSTRTDTYSYNDLIYSHDSNEGSNLNLKCILNFEDIDTKDVYKITRISNSKLSKCSLNVQIEKNGIVIHDGSTREATTYITSLLGTYDDFMTITFMAQNNFHNFLLMSGKNQKEFTSRIFQLDIYDKFHKLSKNDLKIKLIKIKDLREKVNGLSEEKIKNKILTIEDTLSEYVNDKKELQDEILFNKKEKESLLIKLNPLFQDTNNSTLYVLKRILDSKEEKLKVFQDDQFSKDIQEKLIQSLHEIKIKELPNEKFHNTWNEILNIFNLLRESRGKKIINKNISNSSYSKNIKQIEKNIKLVEEFINNIKSDGSSNEKDIVEEIEKIKDNLMEAANNKPSEKLYLTLEKVKDKYFEKMFNNDNISQLLENKYESEKKLLEQYDSDIGTVEEKNYTVIIDEKDIDKLNIELRKIKEQIKIVERAKKRLTNHEYDENCKYCCNNQFVIDAKKDMVEDDKLQTKLKELTETIKILSEKILNQKRFYMKNKIIKNIKELETAIGEYKDKIELKKKIEQIDSNINDKNNQLHKLKKELKVVRSFDKIIKLKDKLIELQDVYTNVYHQIEEYTKYNEEMAHEKNEIEKKLENISEYNNLIEDIKKIKNQMKIKEDNLEIEKENNKIKKTIILLTDQIENNNVKIINIIKSETQLNFDVKESKKILNKLIDNINQLNELKNETVILNHFIAMSHHNGIPSYLLKQITNLLQTNVNSILSEYSNMKVIIKNDNKETSIKINNGSKNGLNVKMLCGSEKFLIELAFRVAFQTLSNVSKPNFIICDEGWSCLDEKTRSQLDYILKTLLEYNEYILTVSHIEDVRKWMNNYIKITVNSNNERNITQ